MKQTIDRWFVKQRIIQILPSNIMCRLQYNTKSYGFGQNNFFNTYGHLQKIANLGKTDELGVLENEFIMQVDVFYQVKLHQQLSRGNS